MKNAKAGKKLNLNKRDVARLNFTMMRRIHAGSDTDHTNLMSTQPPNCPDGGETDSNNDTATDTCNSCTCGGNDTVLDCTITCTKETQPCTGQYNP